MLSDLHIRFVPGINFKEVHGLKKMRPEKREETTLPQHPAAREFKVGAERTLRSEIESWFGRIVLRQDCHIYGCNSGMLAHACSPGKRPAWRVAEVEFQLSGGLFRKNREICPGVNQTNEQRRCRTVAQNYIEVRTGRCRWKF